MEAEASSGVPQTCKKQCRRVWSKEEELVLINALKEIVVGGWKCENGFRTGYLRILEKAIRKVFPDTDIRAQPHVDSKVHVWRKHHSSLTTMVSRSGFAWNAASKMIVVESTQIWDEYVKVHVFTPYLCLSFIVTELLEFLFHKW